MEERRVKLRRHIQAARAWLLQADRSLERKDDVQSDLKLMLAKAELAQTKSSRRTWIKKILPPVTALLIAGAIMLSDRSVEPELKTPPLELTAEATPAEPFADQIITPIEPEPIQESEPIVEEEPIVEPEPTYEPEPYYEPEPTYEPEPYYEPEPIYEAASTYEPEPYYEPEPIYEPAPSVPTENMQQLMLDAGQILRAK